MGKQDDDNPFGIAESDPIKIRLIDQRGESALVEYELDNHISRAYVPKIKISADHTVSLSLLNKAIPYGIPWAELIDYSHITPGVIQEALYRAGIWTIDDLFSRDRSLIGIAINLISKPIMDAAQKLRRQTKGK